MRYTVVWDADVEAQFTQAWALVDSDTHAILTEVANWVDEELVEDPDQVGMPRLDLDARVVVVPLSDSPARVSVTFQILPDDRKVRVLRMVFKN